MTVVIHNKQYTPKFAPGDKVWVATDTYEFTKGEIIDVVLTVCGDNKTVLARYNVACEDVAGRDQHPRCYRQHQRAGRNPAET